MNVDSTQLSDEIEQNATAHLLTSTAIVRGVSGNETRKSNFANVLRQYSIKFGPETVGEVISLFETQLGPRYGFTFHDWLDDTVPDPDGFSAAVEILEQTVVGGNTHCQLTKTYIFPPSTRTRVRKITLPLAATIQVFSDGVLLPSSDWTLSDGGVLVLTGTFSTVISWTGQFYVPVRFLADQLDINMLVLGVNEVSLELIEILPGSPA